ncbi:hypothetical protein EG329_004172 [Mollisiaceae sp. DMI_Dod_QoI]|nr:hypothetical protein EG329_004172 [Helotiales sp. DMI_Dod_QoI]
MDPLSIIAGVVGVVGFAASSATNLLSLIESTRGCPAAVRGTGRDASEFLAVLNTLKCVSIRTSQTALDELLDLVERYAEPSGKINKWNGLKWAFKDENHVKVLNDRLVMSKTTLAFALTTITTLNSMRLNKTQALISDQIRDLRLDLEVKELSSVRPRQGSESRGTELGFTLQRFLNDTSEVVQSPLESGVWMDCSDAITSSFYDNSTFETNDYPSSTPRHNEALWSKLRETVNVDEVDENGDTLLHRAAEAGDSDLVRAILDQKAAADPRNGSGATPLGIAAWNGHIAIARLLLERGANVNAANKDQHTPCHHVAETGNTTMLKLLIDNGADLGAREEDGWTPLYLACSTSRLGAAKMLIDAGSDVMTPATDGTTCLHAAAFEGSTSLLELLLQSGADIKAQDLTGATALHKAVEDDSLKATIVLLESGADIEVSDLEGRTPLFITAEEPSVQCARLLLEKGAKVSARNSKGETPLLTAASLGNDLMVKVLLEFGADINAKDSVEATPLHHAARSEQEMTVELLIERSADIHAVDRFAYTPLHLAVYETSSREIVSLLYGHGADLNQLSVGGATPLINALRREGEVGQMMALHLLGLGASFDLKGFWKKAPIHWAAELGLEVVVTDILERGGDRNILDEHGSSPIHFAAMSGHINCLRILACDGTDLEISDKSSYTALWKAVTNNKDEVAAEMIHILHAAGASIERRENTYDKTPLIWAAEKGLKHIVQALLEHAADIAARDEFGMTAVHYAAENGHLDIVKNLLKEGTDLAWRTYSNETPLWKAYSNKRDEIVAFLVSVGCPDSVLVLTQDGRHEEAAKLIRSGASCTISWQDNRVALHFAAQQGALEFVRLLLDHKSPVNLQDTNGSTALAYALQGGHLDVVRLLLDHSANIFQCASTPPLILAAEGGNVDCVLLLLEKGLDVNATDHEGNSALHRLCNAEKENVAMVKGLLDHGAQPNLEDAEEMTPKMLAEAKEHTGILRILDTWELKNGGLADDERKVFNFAGNKELNRRRFARRDNVQFEMLGRPTW